MYDKLLDLVPQECIREHESMKRHTTFGIGGPADIMIFPRNVDDIRNIILTCGSNNYPFYTIGQGSNLLVTDKGIRGVVIKMGENWNRVKVEGEVINAQAGISLYALSRLAANNSLSGLEFAEGIPGSLGGAVVMNAGAYDGEMQDVVIEVEAIKSNGDIEKFTREQINFGYRSSRFQNQPWVVLEAKLQLSIGDKEQITQKMRVLADKRKSKQPYDFPSAGSVFKRPPGYYVGPMVENLGLKGYRIGGAQVSEKHAGFIVNTGSATAADVLALIQHIQSRAKEQYGVDLHPEIKIIGEM